MAAKLAAERPHLTRREVGKIVGLSERDTVETDVAIVGASPFGLAAALQINEDSPDVSVLVFKKGASVGAHII